MMTEEGWANVLMEHMEKWKKEDAQRELKSLVEQGKVRKAVLYAFQQGRDSVLRTVSVLVREV